MNFDYFLSFFLVKAYCRVRRDRSSPPSRLSPTDFCNAESENRLFSVYLVTFYSSFPPHKFGKSSQDN